MPDGTPELTIETADEKPKLTIEIPEYISPISLPSSPTFIGNFNNE